MEFIGQLFLTQLFRPQLLIGSIAHSGGQMVVDFRAELFQFADMLFDILGVWYDRRKGRDYAEAAGQAA